MYLGSLKQGKDKQVGSNQVTRVFDSDYTGSPSSDKSLQSANHEDIDCIQ
jgi:hypothetical protein